MKHTLLIMRHAKSCWDDPALPDQERPLNKRGAKAAPEMGRRIAKLGLRWDQIITSPAFRARATAEAVADAIGYEKELIISDALYFEGAFAICDLIRSIDESQKRVMIFGHNPDLHDLFERLSGQNLFKFPTAAYALFESKRPWAECDGFKLRDYDYPKSQR
ncbi:MAG: histidine phosphatase family protein [Campylobacterales bacterium]|nr:histidine phosphatase family protein [Campylobacterales bacterium]